MEQERSKKKTTAQNMLITQENVNGFLWKMREKKNAVIKNKGKRLNREEEIERSTETTRKRTYGCNSAAKIAVSLRIRSSLSIFVICLVIISSSTRN